MNQTHDPSLRSWVGAANVVDADFPIQNLPHGVFSTPGEGVRGGVAVGDQILDLGAAASLFDGEVAAIAAAAAEPTLNHLMRLGPAAASRLRARLSEVFAEGSPDAAAARGHLVPQSAARMHLPVKIGGFSDFCTSAPHVAADRPGRPGRPFHPAFKHLPVGYNSRPSSIVVDGQPIRRPNGQGVDASGVIYFGPSRDMDYELELGAFVGAGNALGRPIHVDAAETHIWGYVMVNDWSARDLQRFESMLGPFLSKSGATTISPWVITSEAMEPFRCAPQPRPPEDPVVQPHLTSPRHAARGSLSIRLRAQLRTTRMRDAALPPAVIADTRYGHLYWSLDQMVVHHASNGCNLETGDLLASGTVSGPLLEEAACLWELTGGLAPLSLPNGETRLWLEDGDEVILTGRCEAPGRVSIGFGPCGGELLPALAWPDGPFNPAEDSNDA